MKSILPWWKIGLLLGACGAAVWLLLPDDAQLIEDLLRDGKTKEARRQFSRLTPAKSQSNTARVRRLELQLLRREAETGDATASGRFWPAAMAAWRESQHAETVFQEFLPAVGSLKNPVEIWATVAPHLAGAPAPQVDRLVDAFARTALAAGAPATAAEIIATGRPAATRTAADALALAQLWISAARPEAALAALGDHQTPEVAACRTGLLRALNRNRELLTLLQARLTAAPASLDAVTVAELATVAQQAAAPLEAIPYLRRHLENSPRDFENQRRLRDLLLAAGQTEPAIAPARQAVELAGRRPDDLRALGKTLEYNGHAAAAFDVWLELAPRGDLAAVDRLVALNPGLYRDQELLGALEKIVPVAGRPDYTLRLARLEVVLGRYEQAQIHFELYLAAHADAGEVMLELARLLGEVNRFANAEKWLERAAVLRPADTAIAGERAKLLALQGRYDEALVLYGRLSREAPSLEIVQAYTRLAESLGRYEDLVRGIRAQIALSPTPSANDYLMLAYGYEVAGRMAERRSALAEGLRRVPTSDDLRLQLANALLSERQFPEAQSVLTRHTRLREDAGAVALHLELMRLNHDTDAERRFLALPLAEAVARDENVRERLAVAHEATGGYGEAEGLRRGLLAAHPQDPERIVELARIVLLRERPLEARTLIEPLLLVPNAGLLRLAAEIEHAAGHPRAAERHLLAYLKIEPAATAADWSALGDIRLSRGDRNGAHQAYSAALQRMHAQIAARDAHR